MEGGVSVSLVRCSSYKVEGRSCLTAGCIWHAFLQPGNMLSTSSYAFDSPHRMRPLWLHSLSWGLVDRDCKWGTGSLPLWLSLEMQLLLKQVCRHQFSHSSLNVSRVKMLLLHFRVPVLFYLYEKWWESNFRKRFMNQWDFHAIDNYLLIQYGY